MNGKDSSKKTLKLEQYVLFAIVKYYLNIYFFSKILIRCHQKDKIIKKIHQQTNY
jgi:hypothetical protein